MAEDIYAKQMKECRPLVAALWQAVALDEWPSPACVVDFGIDSQKHYEALYIPIRRGEIKPKELDAALGSGPKLTALVARCRSNPHKGIVFKTAYDL